jgi:D-inositol-3-phosphate glycosyltransferase
MNVYIHELARTMAGRGVEVVVFTRRTAPDQPEIVETRSGYSVVHIEAGPPEDIPIAAMPEFVPSFAEAVIGWSIGHAHNFDLVHSHYWLSGWAGVLVKEALGIPLANSFHTLGRVKDLARRPDEAASSNMRTLTEEQVIASSDCVIASTQYDFDDLLDRYAADPERLCTSPPGVDHSVFCPGDADEARFWLGLGSRPIVLFVGRVQPLKGIDTAIRSVAGLPGEVAAAPGAPHLVVIGGPSGDEGEAELERAVRLTVELGIEDRVHFVTPQPHSTLAGFYRAANVLIMPSRSESFGLVAAEAQACGLPVVAAAVGGLQYVVSDGVSGLLVHGHEPADYTKALERVLDDPGLDEEFRSGALAYSERFSWSATADRLLELYQGITGP